MPELGPYGSVRGALSNERPYRDPGALQGPENHSITLESKNLPCRTEKSAWHLHGCVQVRCNLGIYLLLKQNRPFCFSGCGDARAATRQPEPFRTFR